MISDTERHLQSILSQTDTVLFVGSGISMWSGLPSWRGMVEELSEFLSSKGCDPSLVKRELARGELLQAASYGFDKLTRPQIGEFIRRACRLGKAQPHEIHQKLLTLGPRCFITTNYDRLLEASFQKWQPERYYRTVINRQLTESAEIIAAHSRDFLYKVHGDAGDAESIILTREQYRVLVLNCIS
jgi:NAD-dependent SIR2 family protein deacetylase